MTCACGHTKSKHDKQECTFSQCSCKKFRVEKETPFGDEALVKAITESVDIKIDGEKLLEKWGEITEKRIVPIPQTTRLNRWTATTLAERAASK